VLQKSAAAVAVTRANGAIAVASKTKADTVAVAPHTDDNDFTRNKHDNAHNSNHVNAFHNDHGSDHLNSYNNERRSDHTNAHHNGHGSNHLNSYNNERRSDHINAFHDGHGSDHYAPGERDALQESPPGNVHSQRPRT
jgi:hypothetical protein